jgi:hypothetical protein
MKKTPVNLALKAIAIFFLVLPAAAAWAETPPPPLAEMWLVTPKAGQGDEFRKALAEHMAFRSEHGDPRAWQVYTPLLGDNLSQVAIRFCCFNWADQDSYAAWGSGAEKIQAHFDEHVAPHADKWEHYFESMDWGNSHWAESAGSAKYYAVTEFNIKPGYGQDFDAARDAVSQIALNQGWATDDRSWIWASVIGGSPRESVIIPHADYASFDRGDENFSSFLSRQMGADKASELMKQFSGATEGSTFQIWKHQPDLSMSSED